MPASYADLLALQGIGGYTAAAVASFAFGERRAVVDTNVRRVQARVVTGVALPAPALSAAETRLAEALLPADDAVVGRWNIAVMELGALVCTARAPKCDLCPVRRLCAWQLAGAPPYAGRPHPTQAWDGTDRQVRGRLLAALRATDGPLARAGLRAAGLDLAATDVDGADVAEVDRVDRCLASLVSDGLVAAGPGGSYRLPG